MVDKLAFNMHFQRTFNTKAFITLFTPLEQVSCLLASFTFALIFILSILLAFILFLKNAPVQTERMLIEVSTTVDKMLVTETLLAGEGVTACIANNITVFQAIFALKS